jgi:subtilisin family serine protease
MKRISKRFRPVTRLKIVLGAALLAGLQFALTHADAQRGNAGFDKPQEHRPVTRQPEFVPETKIAPDLEALIDAAAREGRSEERQRVILQLSAEKLNQMARAGVLVSDRAALDEWQGVLGRYEGRLKRGLPNTELLVAEVPLSRLRELQQSADVAYIAPDRAVGSLGHLETTTGAAQVRSLVSGATLNGQSIGIAVLDSGIYLKHNLVKNFPGRPGVVYNKDFTGAKIVDADPYGHGTHVASLAVGDADAGLLTNGAYDGIAPRANLLNLRVLDNNGRGLSSYVIAAIDWCIANKATYNIRVINLSLGAPARDSYRVDPLCLAVRRAVNAGIVVVASAGNNGKAADGSKLYGMINSPGIEPSAITVGAANTYGTNVRSDDRVASFSSRGPTRGYTTNGNGIRVYDNLLKPDLVAPGNRLIAACADNAYLPSNYPTLIATTSGPAPDQLLYLSGTSMSAPTVAGAVALMLQANPNLTPNLVKAILMFSAQLIPNANTFDQGAGLLNVDGAVRLARLVKANAASFSNGAALLNASLPSPQQSVISGQTVVWSQGVITNHTFLYGSALMNYWQGMYGNGVTMSDATPINNGALVRSNSLATSGAGLAFGPVTTIGNGVTMSDGIPLMSGMMLGNNFIGQGFYLGDGNIVGDGAAGDALPAAAQTLFGDNTAAMQPVP